MLNLIKSTLKNTFIYSIGTFASRLVAFVLIPLYTSNFDVEQYGMLGIMEISSQVLIALLGLGLFNAYFRWYWDPKYAHKQKSLLFTILVFLFFQMAIFLMLILAFKKEFSILLFETGQYTYLVQLTLYVSAFEAIAVLVSTILRLKEQASYYTYIQVTKLLVSLFVIVYLIKFRDKNIEAVYEGFLVANVVYFILIINLIRKNIEFKFEWRILREMLSFSLPLMLTSISGIILTITDRFTLRFLSDFSTVGVYTLGFKIANTIRVVVIGSVNLALQPVIFKMMDVQDNKRFYSKVMTYYTFGLMFFVLFFALFSAEMIKIISKSTEYWDAYKIVPVLSLSMLFTMLRDVSYTGLNKMKKTRTIAMILIGASILNIGLNVLFIPIWGYFGAACATTTSQFIFFILVYIFSQKQYFIPYELHKVFLMVFIGVILFFVSQITVSFPLVYRLPVKFGLIMIFPLVLYTLRFYESIELERMGQFWMKWRNPANWKKNLNNLKFN